MEKSNILHHKDERTDPNSVKILRQLQIKQQKLGEMPKTITDQQVQIINEAKAQLIKDGLPITLEKVYEAMDIGTIKFDSIDDVSSIYGWVQQGDEFHVTAKHNIPSLVAGYFNIIETYNGYYLRKKNLFLDELYKLPQNIVDTVIDDLKTFWERKDKYKEYGITYKRGALLWGPQGCGKSSIINFLVHVITTQFNGLVFEYTHGCEDIIRQIRLMEPDKPIMVIMEDVDAILSNGSSRILNLLDGNNQIDNIVYFATTNYPERIEPRFFNRPSRFDLVLEMELPDDEVRKFFIEKKLKDDDLAMINVDEWVKDTNGMSLSHVKELIISVIVMGKDYQVAITRLRNMNAGD